MTAAISSAQPVAYVSLPTGSGADEVTPDTAQPPQQQTAPALTGSGAVVSDSTLGALVAQQDPSADAAKDLAKTPAAIDLKGQDLSKTDLKNLDLRGADLSGANLSGRDLSGRPLSEHVKAGILLSYR
jgi:hypothetical protein